MKAFVYGILRKGGPTVRTKPEFNLYSCFSYPMLKRGGSTVVTGEMVEFRPAQWDSIRAMEHCAGYDLETIELEDGTPVKTFIHRSEIVFRAELVPCGDWLLHRAGCDCVGGEQW